ncbi:hypothetical protein BDB01DRAFT_137258 [Pilobolus umbonatus]|nr:hypothetical protein BDB01DRAFT_137258 [Pilobolus umbonatus]
MTAETKLQTLCKWLDDNKVKWNKEGLDIKTTNGSFGIYAKTNLKKGLTVARIPKECILSIKTTGIANILEEANLEGGCALALAVLYEIAQGEQSPWYGYLQALPDQGEDLPMFWEDEEKELFSGTEMEAAIHSDLDDLEDDYAELIEPILDAHPYIFHRGDNEDNDPYSFDKFIKISTLISSRNFEVDAYHENALVPFADIFNHKGENEHVHFETEFEVCDACGALEYCEHQFLDVLEDEEDEEEHKHDKDNSENEEWESEEEDEGDSDVEKDTELPDLDELEKAGVDFYEDEDDEDEKKDTCDMVLDRPVKKGEEIFNTYGDHPNIALLSKYGFCYDDNHNDYISIGEDSIVDCCMAITAEILKGKNPKATPEELEEMAFELTRPRWEFFLKNEHILCPAEDEHGGEGMEGGCQDGCCGEEHSHSHGKAHGDSHGEEEDDEEHMHDENGGCCGGEEGEEEEEEGRGRPYFINYEGLFEDKIMVLLHILFMKPEKFKTFVDDMDNALSYFEEIASDQGKNRSKDMIELKKNIYQVCRALVEFRRLDYLEENGEWKPIETEIKEREKVANNKRKYYALTCRISEKKIAEKAFNYYNELVEEYTKMVPTPAKVNKKKKPVKRARK